MKFLDRLNHRLQTIFGTKLFTESVGDDPEQLLDYLQSEKWQTPDGTTKRLNDKAANYFRQREMGVGEILNALRDHNMLSDAQVRSLMQRFGRTTTSANTPEYQDPNSPDYDRQRAENALYHTIGPLTDSPRWVNSGWSDRTPGGPVPGFEPGAPAPRWTPDQVVMAMAGDPKLLFKAKDNPRSPGYGPRGGSPIFRVATQLARQFGIPKDKSQIEDMYQTGLVQLVTLMQPGYDESRSPFVSYVFPQIKGAMKNGVGGSQQTIDATKDTGEKSNLIGMGQLLDVYNPELVRDAANQVRGEYQITRSHAKHPDNPFGALSPAYYRTAMNYADALESGDEARIEDARQKMREFIEQAKDAAVPIRSVGTGLGQAVSNVDRKTAVGVQSMNVETGEDGSTMAGNIAGDDGTDSWIGPEQIHLVLDIAMNYDLGKVLKNSEKYKSMAREIFYREADAKFDRAMEEYEANVQKHKQWEQQVAQLKPEITKLKAEKDKLEQSGQTEEAAKIKIPELPTEPKIRKMPSVPVKNRKISIGGPMTANELRHMIRALGPLGSNYPGRGTPRKNTNVPRDAAGWWQPGEDPEIEPIPSGGTWHSIWERNGYPSMIGQPSAIAEEFTKEVLEFNKLGIESARSKKVAETGTAMSKVAVNTTLQSAKIKFEIVAHIHKHELGMDESIFRGLPILEGVSQADRFVIVETCNWIIRQIDKMLEEAPPGWKGSVKAMKKHKDKFDTDDKSKINPFALAWSMHKKGAKPHYKNKDGKPEKKKQYTNEEMQPVEAIDFD